MDVMTVCGRGRWRVDMKSDAQLKREVEDELKWAEGVPSDAIAVRVDRGCVTLTGEVDWGAQRHTAELVASRTLGVIGVMNQITVQAAPSTAARMRARKAALLSKHMIHRAF